MTQQEYKTNLGDLIAYFFDESELRVLCFDLDIDYDNLPGGPKESRIRELIDYVERRGELDKLILICQKSRPMVVWPDPDSIQNIFEAPHSYGQVIIEPIPWWNLPERIKLFVSEHFSNYPLYIILLLILIILLFAISIIISPLFPNQSNDNANSIATLEAIKLEAVILQTRVGNLREKISTLSITPTLSTCSPPSGWVLYSINPGDTLFGLAQNTGTTVAEIQSANCLGDNLINTGQPIYLPSQPVPPPSPSSTSESDTILEVSQKPSSLAAVAYELTVDELGYGTMEISLPISPTVGQSEFLRLEIIPDQELASLISVAAPITLTISSTSQEKAQFFTITDDVQIYSIMIAELSGSENVVAVEPQGEERKSVQPGIPVVWTWIVTPKSSGRLPLSLRISIPSIIDNNQEEIVELLKDIPLYLDVSAPPSTTTPAPLPSQTPVPTFTPSPTPIPSFLERVIEDPINFLGIILTFIVGVAGVVVAYLAYRNSKNTTSVTSTVPQDKDLSSSVMTTAELIQSPSPLDTTKQVELHQMLDDNFNDQELRTLCLELGVDYDDLPFPGQTNKARELVALMARNGRLGELEAIIKRERPHLFSADEEQGDEDG